MSDKISGFTVVFEKSVSEEYMDAIQQAVSLLKGVAKVDRVIEDTSTYMGQMQESTFIKDQLLNLIRSDFGRREKKNY